jgi:hypothetical protein
LTFSETLFPDSYGKETEKADIPELGDTHINTGQQTGSYCYHSGLLKSLKVLQKDTNPHLENKRCLCAEDNHK